MAAEEGEVGPAPTAEYGMYDPAGQPFTVHLTPEGQQDWLLRGMESLVFRVFQMHKLMVRLGGATNAVLLGEGKYCPVQVLKVGRWAYGFQSHIEFAPWMMRYFMTKVRDFYESLPADTLEVFMRFYDEYLALATLWVNNLVDMAEERRRQRV